jgi:hypothetical protein
MKVSECVPYSQYEKALALLQEAMFIIKGTSTTAGLVDCLDSYYYDAYREEIQELSIAAQILLAGEIATCHTTIANPAPIDE